MRRSEACTGSECVVGLVEKIAEKEGVEPHELPPSYDTLEIEFIHSGYSVTILDASDVRVENADRSATEND